MTTTLQTIPIPRVNGSRASFVSIEMKYNGLIFVGVTKISYSRTRDVTVLYGTNSDPLGQTAGTNAYDASFEMYLAEYLQVQAAMGKGYADKYFTTTATYSAGGMDLCCDTLIGCRLLETKADHSQGNEGLKRSWSCKPVKILFNGLDDNVNPLGGQSRAA